MTTVYAVASDGSARPAEDRRDASAFGSTLHVETPATVAVDPGAMWTGIVARFGGEALNGTVVGAFPGVAAADRGRVDLENDELWFGYRDRVLSAVNTLWDLCFGEIQVRVVVEHIRVPRRPSQSTKRRIPLWSWLPTRELVAAVVGTFPGAVIVDRDHFGQRHLVEHGGTGDWRDYYPPQLYGARPDDWLPSDHPRNVRDHERAAFDAAGVAHMLRADTAA